MKYFRNLFLSVFYLLSTAYMQGNSSFEEQQKKNERVADAYSRKEVYILMKCRTNEIPEDSFGNFFIRVFKREGLLEEWVQKPDGKYVQFNQFKIYSMSGTLGPKRVQGDKQVPEGYYYINEFNPYSQYHLSLGINYPNESDIKLSDAPKKGGGIYLHGGAVSAGCIAMSNYYIEDIYICAVKAKTNGQKNIPVQIYPFMPTKKNLDYYNRFAPLQPHSKFWQNLAQGYRLFEKTKRLPEVSVGEDGYYTFNEK